MQLHTWYNGEFAKTKLQRNQVENQRSQHPWRRRKFIEATNQVDEGHAPTYGKPLHDESKESTRHGSIWTPETGPLAPLENVWSNGIECESESTAAKKYVQHWGVQLIFDAETRHEAKV